MTMSTTNAAVAASASVRASCAWACSTGARVKRRSSQPFTRDSVPWQRAHDSLFRMGWMTAYSVSFPPGEPTMDGLSNRWRSRQGTVPRRRGDDDADTLPLGDTRLATTRSEPCPGSESSRIGTSCGRPASMTFDTPLATMPVNTSARSRRPRSMSAPYMWTAAATIAASVAANSSAVGSRMRERMLESSRRNARSRRFIGGRGPAVESAIIAGTNARGKPRVPAG